jgi:hypothetical protein
LKGETMLDEKTFTIFGREFEAAESILAERHLTKCFLDMCAEFGIDHGDDSAAWREDFNNWTDSLNRNGDICDSAYDSLCPIGRMFD